MEFQILLNLTKKELNNCKPNLQTFENRIKRYLTAVDHTVTYLFLGESIAAPVLADLVTLLVPAGCAVPAVVLPLAARTFSAPFSLLLRRLLVRVRVLTPVEERGAQVQAGRVRTIARGIGWRLKCCGKTCYCVRSWVCGRNCGNLARGVRQAWV
jgi:hypothetical protein